MLIPSCSFTFTNTTFEEAPGSKAMVGLYSKAVMQREPGHGMARAIPGAMVCTSKKKPERKLSFCNCPKEAGTLGIHQNFIDNSTVQEK